MKIGVILIDAAQLEIAELVATAAVFPEQKKSERNWTPPFGPAFPNGADSAVEISNANCCLDGHLVALALYRRNGQWGFPPMSQGDSSNQEIRIPPSGQLLDHRYSVSGRNVQVKRHRV